MILPIPTATTRRSITSRTRSISCARKVEPDEPGIRIEKVVWAMDGNAADNNTRIPLSRLLEGLIVSTDQTIAADSISRATCYMVMEIPTFPPDQESWLYPIVIRAEEAANANDILWKPRSVPVSILDALARLNSRDREKGLLARFTLKGNFIRDIESKLYLDGEDYGVPDGSAPFNLLPLDGGFISGNKRIGGDFYMWFWVVPDQIPEQPGKLRLHSHDWGSFGPAGLRHGSTLQPRLHQHSG